MVVHRSVTARLSRLWIVALLAAGCQAVAAPSAPPAATPQIIYVTAPPVPLAQPTPIIVYVTPEPAPSGTVHALTGTFSLRVTSQNWTVTSDRNGKTVDCRGLNGYADFRAGMPVVAKDQAGAIVATAATEFAKVDGSDCVLKFALTVPDAPFYSLEAGHRGAITYSRADLDAKGWKVALTLG